MQFSEQTTQNFLAQVNFDLNGLVPAVVQQFDSKTVLMLAYMNADSLYKTLRTGNVTYYSRSRDQLWLKGASSGNTQELIYIAFDCDADTLLVQVNQKGPACHTGNETCFDGCLFLSN